LRAADPFLRPLNRRRHANRRPANHSDSPSAADPCGSAFPRS